MRVQVVLLLWLLGCAPPPPPAPTPLSPLEVLERDHCTGTSVIDVDARTTADTFYEGTRRRITFTVRGALTCDSGGRPIEVVSASSNAEAVEVTVERVSALEHRAHVDLVVPAAATLGLRLVVEPHVSVRDVLVPVVGLAQREWTRTTAPGCLGRLEPPFGSFCVGAQRVTLPLGGGPTALPALAAAATTSMLWLFDGAGVTGWSLDGGVAREVSRTRCGVPVALNTRGARLAFIADDELVVLAEPGAVVGRTRFAPAGKAFRALQFRDDARLFVFRGNAFDEVPTPTTPAETFTLFESVDEPDTTVTTNAEGVWVRAFEPQDGVTKLTLVGASGFGTRFRVRPVPFLPAPLLTPDSSPLFAFDDAHVELVRPGPAVGEVTRALVSLPAGAAASWATTTSLFAVDGDGGLWVAPRAGN
jgi:hypothetical protein